ncbi:DndE family protein [Oxalobacteraceae sp. CFBP 8763]|nr:DndE family protein [Oxalobacteraceae sp. CFBP 8763]
MLPKRLRITQEATETLKLIKARTGVTPNIACRLALIVSLERGAVEGQHAAEQVGSEFNSSTLFGEHENLFETLILEVHGFLGQKEKVDTIVSHIGSGLTRLRKAKNLNDLMLLVNLDRVSPSNHSES